MSTNVDDSKNGSFSLEAPHFVNIRSPGDQPQLLERVNLHQGIPETWLQQLIDSAPDILPVAAIDRRINGKLISLGREIPTPSGPIDNVLLSQSGHLVVVETKLWRNPEARRKVVAQLLDYAGHIKEWDYQKIEKLFMAQHPKGSLWETVAPEEDESSWIDKIDHNLKYGRMALLVVGDGIRSRAETLAEVVGSQPMFEFRLALLELRLYKADDDRYLIVPHTLARTKEIERATVRVAYEQQAAPPKVEVEVPMPDPKGKETEGSRVTLDAQAFYEDLESYSEEGKKAAPVAKELLRHIESHEELRVEWGSGGFSVRTIDPRAEGELLSLVVVRRPNLLYAYPEWIGNQIRRNWNDDRMANQIADKLGQLMRGLGAKTTPSGKQYNIELTDIEGKEADVVSALENFVIEIGEQAQQS
jgi:hypothetical protein